ncbi:MAG: hypothetical protein PHT12_00360 [Patescibacteria group bacterium]|nr:hypothetical protein [Patescibacteria group bacterium]
MPRVAETLRAAIADKGKDAVARTLRRVQNDFECGGHATIDAFRLDISRALGLTEPLTWQEFAHGYLVAPILMKNTGLAEIQQWLTRAGYPQGILSNLCPIWQRMWQKRGLMDFAEGRAVYSCFAGAVKPSEALVRQSIRMMCREPKNIFFIDDNPDNIRMVEKAGATGCLYENNLQLHDWLLAVGMPPDLLAPLLSTEPLVPIVVTDREAIDFLIAEFGVVLPAEPAEEPDEKTAPMS